MTHIEVLSSYKPVPGFQGGTVGQTAVTKIEKIRHGFGHYSSYTFCPIYNDRLQNTGAHRVSKFRNLSTKYSDFYVKTIKFVF